eukprot:1753575-Rhodomonas_salina.1
MLAGKRPALQPLLGEAAPDRKRWTGPVPRPGKVDLVCKVQCIQNCLVTLRHDRCQLSAPQSASLLSRRPLSSVQKQAITMPGDHVEDAVALRRWDAEVGWQPLHLSSVRHRPPSRAPAVVDLGSYPLQRPSNDSRPVPHRTLRALHPVPVHALRALARVEESVDVGHRGAVVRADLAGCGVT